MRFLLLVLPLALVLAALPGCDAGFSGDPNANRPPETELSVRVTDLRETIGGTLESTVAISWAGTDPDGFVAAYELRYYDASRLGQVGPEEGWVRTTRRDTTILLPIPPGEDNAAVVVEVRAEDNDGARDATPARTVFPIRNAPPTFRLIQAEVPPDTTWPVFSFAWAAADPEGPTNLAAIEVAFNDTTAFTRLPADADFATFVAVDPRAGGTTEARVFLGRSFQSTQIFVPGLRLDADNVVYLRAVDQTDTTSATVRYPAEGDPFFVRRVTSDVLLVNDFRASADVFVLPVARTALARYGTTTYDTWDLSETPQTSQNPQYSEPIPVNADPTLRHTLALWDAIYWVSNTATNRIRGNNLPLAASVMDLFFSRGGRLMAMVPVTLPLSGSEEENEGNAALNVLPLRDLITLPVGSTNLRIRSDEPVVPDQPVPGTGQPLPPLRTTQIVTGALPYEIGADDVPLYRAQFYDPRTNQNWTGSNVVASMSQDRRVGLFALPAVNTTTGALLLAPPPGGTADLYDALARMLAGLDFPH